MLVKKGRVQSDMIFGYDAIFSHEQLIECKMMQYDSKYIDSYYKCFQVEEWHHPQYFSPRV